MVESFFQTRVSADGYLRDNEILLLNKYEPSILLWTIGVFCWSMFLFFRMARVGTVLTVPILYRVQMVHWRLQWRQ